MKAPRITEGRVRVNEPHHFISNPNFHVFEFDLDSKYPGEVYWVTNSKMIKFIIAPCDRTLNLREVEKDTEVTFGGINGYDWSVLTEARRYTWRIVFYRNKLIDTGEVN